MAALNAYLNELRASMEDAIAASRSRTFAELESVMKEFEADAGNTARAADRKAMEEICQRVVAAMDAMEADMRSEQDKGESRIRASVDEDPNATFIMIEGEGTTFHVGDYYVPPPSFPPM